MENETYMDKEPDIVVEVDEEEVDESIDEVDNVRTTFYAPRTSIRMLKSELAKEGKTISGWLRETIDKELQA